MKECHICMRKVENNKIQRYKYKEKIVKACPECITIDETQRKEKQAMWLERFHTKGFNDEDIKLAINNLQYALKSPNKSELAEKFNGMLGKFIEDNEL